MGWKSWWSNSSSHMAKNRPCQWLMLQVTFGHIQIARGFVEHLCSDCKIMTDSHKVTHEILPIIFMFITPITKWVLLLRYYSTIKSIFLWFYFYILIFFCREATDLWDIFSLASIISYLMLQLCFQTGVSGFESHLFSLIAASRLRVLLVKWKYRSYLTYDEDGVISQ